MFAQRVDIPAAQAMAQTVAHAEKHGAPLGPAIQFLLQDLHHAHINRLETHAQKLPVKLLAPLLLCIFPSLMLLMLAPLMIELMGFSQ